jgi:hypothetical protein
MSGTGFAQTEQDVRRMQHEESKRHPGGDIPKGSAAAAAQVNFLVPPNTITVGVGRGGKLTSASTSHSQPLNQKINPKPTSSPNANPTSLCQINHR